MCLDARRDSQSRGWPVLASSVPTFTTLSCLLLVPPDVLARDMMSCYIRSPSYELIGGRHTSQVQFSLFQRIQVLMLSHAPWSRSSTRLT